MSDFKREDRYIVIKRSDLDKLKGPQVDSLRLLLSKVSTRLPSRECVVVESDWPEYHLVWAMIEHRMAGKPVPNFNDWRRADELQQRLTAADQEIDDLRAELAAVSLGPCKMIVGDELP